jgi:N-acetylglucosamine-6-sulfatase
MPCSAEVALSVVVMILDDLRADHLPELPLTTARLADHAVQFDRAYVTTPMCCPERSSFLSGGWLPMYTGVLSNEAPRGGATVFVDDDTLATRLQAGGYATALHGKYLNEYGELGLYIPPGWTDFAAVAEGDPWVNATVTSGSSSPGESAPGVEVLAEGYYADWMAERAGAFIAAHPTGPLFLYSSFRAPHDPYEPEPEDEGGHADFRWRGGAWQEADVSDKPAWVQRLPRLGERRLAELDEVHRAMLDSLASVDRAMVSILDALDASGRLDSTVVIVTSDDGQQWLEHRITQKGVAYEESVRVPLVVWHPSFRPHHTDALVAANLDLAATTLDLAGLPSTGNGKTLRPVLCDERDTHRDLVPLQAWPSRFPTWAGVVTPEWKYVETGTGEVELYDLDADPIEAESVVVAHPDVVTELAAEVAATRGLAVITADLPGAEAGASWNAELRAWGGEGRLTWSLVGGSLPIGITLAGDGALSGTLPLDGQDLDFTVEVVDEGASPVHGGPQRDRRRMVVPVSGGCGCEGEEGAAGGVALLFVAWWRRARRQ